MLYPGGGYPGEYFPLSSIAPPVPTPITDAVIGPLLPPRPRRRPHDIRATIWLDLLAFRLELQAMAIPANMALSLDTTVSLPLVTGAVAMTPADIKALLLLDVDLRPDLTTMLKALDIKRKS